MKAGDIVNIFNKDSTLYKKGTIESISKIGIVVRPLESRSVITFTLSNRELSTGRFFTLYERVGKEEAKPTYYKSTQDGKPFGAEAKDYKTPLSRTRRIRSYF